MSRHRYGPNSEHSNQFSPSAKKTSPAAIHSPRKGLIAGPISNELHRTPVAVAVSATGERTICSVDAVNAPMNLSSTNPFANEHKELVNEHKELGCIESTSDEMLQKLPSKKQRAQLQRRRKLQEKERRRTTKIILTQRNSAKPKPQVVQKFALTQTDPLITGFTRPPDYIGDAAKPSRDCYEVSLSPRTEKSSLWSISELSCSNKKFTAIDNFFLHFMPESLKIIFSFMIMIILIFWLTSIILDVEVPSDFFRMATNYVRSFRWGSYRKQQQTNAEKCLEYLTKLFK